jgi:hypothetical protein
MRIICLVLAIAVSLDAQPPPERVAWNRTTESFAGKFVVVELTSGTRAGGTWVSVNSNTFSMNVEQTSNKREVGKGLRSMPRSAIVKVRAGKRRVRGRVIGVLAGFYSIAGVGGAVSGKSDVLQGPVGIAAFGGAIAGYFIGKSFDHATREVVLVPDDLK